jgi:hypothetical protein
LNAELEETAAENKKEFYFSRVSFAHIISTEFIALCGTQTTPQTKSFINEGKDKFIPVKRP